MTGLERVHELLCAANKIFHEISARYTGADGKELYVDAWYDCDDDEDWEKWHDLMDKASDLVGPEISETGVLCEFTSGTTLEQLADLLVEMADPECFTPKTKEFALWAFARKFFPDGIIPPDARKELSQWVHKWAAE